MIDVFADGIILPMIVLIGLGWCVPQLLGKVMPEGTRPLVLLSVIAVIVVAVLAGFFFLGMYVARGAPVSAFSVSEAVFHFGRLALQSGLLWAPVLVLSIANLPRKWVNEVW